MTRRDSPWPAAHGRRWTALLLASACLLLAACAAVPPGADPASDAPESRTTSLRPVIDAPDYAQALQRWRDAEDVNAWIGERFSYDMPRALQLSETQALRGARLPVHEPADFYAAPHGVCVDLARFGVEALLAVDPRSQPSYLMIEFDPRTLQGQTLRRHWVASFRRDDGIYFYADSKRPGHIAGPYADAAAFVADYARYRGRQVVSFRELPSFERQQRVPARRTAAEPRS